MELPSEESYRYRPRGSCSGYAVIRTVGVAGRGDVGTMTHFPDRFFSVFSGGAAI